MGGRSTCPRCDAGSWRSPAGLHRGAPPCQNPLMLGAKETVIVWDLETVPDLDGFATANGLIGKTNEEVRQAIGEKFPKHIYHSIVCIGALIAHSEKDH